MANPYMILGVKRSSSLAEIKAAYRALAHKYHPDVSSEPDALVKMREINRAYETVLKAPRYLGHTAQTTRVDMGQSLRRWGSIG